VDCLFDCFHLFAVSLMATSRTSKDFIYLMDLLGISKKEAGQILGTLPPREIKIVRMYYGLSLTRSFNFREIGELFGISGERISQIKSKSFRRMRFRHAHRV